MKRTVLISMLDVSGDTHPLPRESVAATRAALPMEGAAVEAWLEGRCPTRFVLFDAVAREVARDEFWSAERGGGSMASSALRRCAEIVEADHPVGEWDVLVVIFSDFDNWSRDDDLECVRILRDRLLPRITALGCCKLRYPGGYVSDGLLFRELTVAFDRDPRVLTAVMREAGAFARKFAERVESLAPP